MSLINTIKNYKDIEHKTDRNKMIVTFYQNGKV